MRKGTQIFSAMFLVAILSSLAACSPLALYNGTVPKDAGSTVVRAIAYGEAERQMLDVYRPNDRADGGHPVVFFIYGGAWNSGARGDYDFVGRAFAARGYVTVIADYRLVPDIAYPVFIEDGAKALAWTVETITDHGGDADRLYLAGHSAGAYNAVMLAMAPEFLAAEGVSRSVIDGVAALSGPYDFLPFDEPETIAAFGRASDADATQPIKRPAAGSPPMLLIHGEADDRVMPHNSTALADHLRAAGVPVDLDLLPGADHADTLLALSRPFREDLPVLDTIDGFFQTLD